MADHFPYNTKLKEYASKLRKQSTLAEVLLWRKINRRQILNCDFDRQKPILNYIVDFFCQKMKLAVEIDGSTHWGKERYDNKRLNDLNKMGITVLVFSDRQVKNNVNSVVAEITDWVEARNQHEISRLNPPRRPRRLGRHPSPGGDLI